MQGLELSREYFHQYGYPMLCSQFSDLLPYLAAGFIGSGSDRFGFDDSVSEDHDFEPGFCLFLPDEDVISRREAFLLERAYAKLPGEFHGISRLRISPVGGNRNGVIRTADFYLEHCGSPDGDLSVEAWLNIPDYALAEATNGDVFFDNYGEFTKIRVRLQQMPRDILLKRISANLLLAAQSGQYNYSRCLMHGEPEAAILAKNEFALSAMRVLFYAEGKYMPYYKWCFRAFKGLHLGEELEQLFSAIMIRNDDVQVLIEKLSERLSEYLQKNKLYNGSGSELKLIAYSIQNSISDAEIRNMNILEGI